MSKKLHAPRTLAEWNERGKDYLPGLLGFVLEEIETDRVVGSLDIRPQVMSWNGFLHAGTIVSFADTCCGYGTLNSLPDGADGFTTAELKSNFVGTEREGRIRCVAVPVHRGRTTQVWDATVMRGDDRPIAHFRCTQIVLWPG